VASLLAAPALKSTKLLFAITSPDLCNGVCLSSASNLFSLNLRVFAFESESKEFTKTGLGQQSESNHETCVCQYAAPIDHIQAELNAQVD